VRTREEKQPQTGVLRRDCANETAGHVLAHVYAVRDAPTLDRSGCGKIEDLEARLAIHRVQCHPIPGRCSAGTVTSIISILQSRVTARSGPAGIASWSRFVRRFGVTDDCDWACAPWMTAKDTEPAIIS
jgi:hypothetical protein